MRTPGGQSVWLGLTSLKREWLGPGEVTVLTLRAAVLGAGVYLLDGYRVSLCAWRTGASQPEQPFSPPVACPLPVGIGARREGGGVLTRGRGAARQCERE